VRDEIGLFTLRDGRTCGWWCHALFHPGNRPTHWYGDEFTSILLPFVVKSRGTTYANN